MSDELYQMFSKHTQEPIKRIHAIDSIWLYFMFSHFDHLVARVVGTYPEANRFERKSC